MKRSLPGRLGIAAASLLLVLTGHPASAIVGGQYGGTPGSQINYLAALQVPGIPVSQYFCGGVLVKPKAVLTAAHCVPPSPGGPGLQVRVGSESRSTGGTLVAAAGFTAHPTWDLMVVRLAAAVPEEPVAIRDTGAPVGTAVTIAGWGRTSSADKDYPDRYHVANTTIAPPEACAEILGALDADLCVNNLNGRGPCRGDDGGPVIDQQVGSTPKDDQLAGVIRTVECGAKPSVAVNVPHLRDWIDANAG